MQQHPMIECGQDVSATAEEVRASSVFGNWLARINRSDIVLLGVRVFAAHRFGKSGIKMLHVEAVATDLSGRDLPGISFLRGDTVNVLALLNTPERPDTHHVVMVAQARVPGAQTMVLSNPSGMVDEDESFSSAALRELAEELGEDGTIKWSPLVNMGELYTGSAEPMLLSPGGSDERTKFYVTSATVSETILSRLRFKFAGVETEGEHLQVLVYPLDGVEGRLAYGGSPDAQTALSLLLHDKVKGRI